MSDSLIELRDALRAFTRARDWQLAHNPKNLAMALIVEAGELVEQFQWLTPEQSAELPEAQAAAVREEVADVLIYLIELADVLNVDLAAAVRDKMAKNALKYPAGIGSSAMEKTAQEIREKQATGRELVPDKK